MVSVVCFLFHYTTVIHELAKIKPISAYVFFLGSLTAFGSCMLYLKTAMPSFKSANSFTEKHQSKNTFCLKKLSKLMDLTLVGIFTPAPLGAPPHQDENANIRTDQSDSSSFIYSRWLLHDSTLNLDALLEFQRSPTFSTVDWSERLLQADLGISAFCPARKPYLQRNRRSGAF